jgi:eukaryotic-like serine/threonine-protein kinase
MQTSDEERASPAGAADGADEGLPFRTTLEATRRRGEVPRLRRRAPVPAWDMVSSAMPTARRLSERFTLLRPLGKGGFGEVFLAHDSRLDAEVALKRLARFDPGALIRFKREFRSIADVSHPNLVRLHELYADGDDWYFTMDYVPGPNLAEHLRGRGGSLLEEDTLDERGASGGAALGRDSVLAPLVDEVRMRSTFLQIAQGLRALHAAGFLHRDLKPGNILVSPEGRATILDLGLSARLVGLAHSSVDAEIVGTPGYMAPEQAAGESVSPATDWFAFGVMLYFALTGRLPYSGGMRDILRQQRELPAPDPRRHGPAPEDLAELCVRLLQFDPAARAGAEEVLSVLSGVVQRPAATTPAPGDFIGREREVSALLEMLAATRRARTPLVVEVLGTSGMGKSALVQRFLEEAGLRHAACTLAGRCYERESMPFKALDEVVDQLTQHLRALPDTDAALLMPRDPHALARVFPVFGRIGAVQRAPEGRPVENPQERRRFALRALRETLARLADRSPVVLFIDDLQWADADSVQLLAELLLPPEPPPVMLVFAYREEERERNEILSRARDALKHALRGLKAVSVGPLGEAEAAALVRQLLPDVDDALRERIATESERVPYLLLELCRVARIAAAEGVSLSEVLDKRLAGLPPAERALLEVISLAGGPLDLDVAARAAGLEGAEALAALGSLRGALLVRTRLRAERSTVEPYHDRVREQVAASLDGDVARRHHAALAREIESRGGADPETLARHFMQAGDPTHARPYVIAAAAKATDGLAFDRAATLYAEALAAAEPTEQKELLVKRAEALSFAGRGREAGERYEEAAQLSGGEEELTLRRLAAEKLLRSGAIVEGKRALQAALRHARFTIPESELGAIGAALLENGRLRFRGDEPASAVTNDPVALERIDVCWAVATGLAGLDPLRGRLFATRHLRLALDSGEPMRIGRGLALEGIFGVGSSKHTFPRGVRLIERAAEIAEASGDGYAIGWARGAAACLAWYSGSFREAAELCAFADAVLRACRADTTWERNSISVFWHLPSLLFAADLGGLRREASVLVHSAVERSDLYSEANLRTAITPWVLLLDGDAAGARREVDEMIARFPVDGWLRVHQAAVRARSWSALAVGTAPALTEAAAHLEETRPRLLSGWLMKGFYERIFNGWVRGNVAVALARLDASARPRLLSIAREEIESLTADENPWATGVATALRAGVAAAERDPKAPALYETVASAFEVLDMPLHAAAALRRRGEIIGGEAGATQIARADAAMRELGVTAPEAFSRVLVA